MPPSKIVQRQPSVDLPSWLAEGIGRIASEWSHLEWQFEDAIRLLLQTDVKRGRIVTTGMNMKTRITCLTSLMQAMNFPEPLMGTLSAIGNRISNQLEGERNKLVHGLWTKAGKKWRLVIRSGTHQQPLPSGAKPKRSVIPEQEHVTPTSLADILDRIRHERFQMKTLRQQIVAALPPSPDKSP